MFERCYEVAGCSVRVRGRGEDLAEVLDAWFESCAPVASPLAPDITIEVDRCAATPEIPSKPRKFHFPPLVAFDANEDGWHLVDEVGWLDVDPLGGRASGAVHVDARPQSLFDFVAVTLWLALIECLRARDRYLLHAAALVNPSGQTVVLAGTRGAGKSTLTLSLLEAGYFALSDDTVFVHRGRAGALELLGHPRRFQVRPDLLDHRPRLAALVREPKAFEPQDKKWIAQFEAFRGQMCRRAAAPSRIFLPAITSERSSCVVPVAGRQALLRMLEHSCFVFVQPRLAPGHLDVLRELVDGAVTAELRCGLDLLRDPLRVAALIEDHLHRREACSSG